MKLMESVHDVARRRHLAATTEKRYTEWVRRFILFHGKRHPLTMGKLEIEAFLTDLAVRKRLSAGSQNQALSAVLFLYRDVLELEADVVMFIHRPDACNAEGSLQSLAKIIVAKHRNGPVHAGIELVFRRELATFENGGSVGCGGSEAGRQAHPGLTAPLSPE